MQPSLEHIRKEWKGLSNQYPFDYFMDEQLNRFYKKDNQLLQILAIFAALAIGIACMGLFGLSVYTARQRTKEIGVRKVLGASVMGIAVLISNEFIRLVIIASLISFPVAWWVTHKWLQDFAYRIDIKWWFFGVAGLSALVVAIVTISVQAIKAAIANPVVSLRTE